MKQIKHATATSGAAPMQQSPVYYTTPPLGAGAGLLGACDPLLS